MNSKIYSYFSFLSLCLSLSYLHTWNKLEILQDILQFKIIWMEGQEHFDGRTGTFLRKGRIIRYTFMEEKDH